MLSIVIPVYNEAESLAELHREIGEVAAANGYDIDVVFVDDGSQGRFVEHHPPPGRRGIAGPRHPLPAEFRQGGRAPRAAFAVVRGEMVMTMDADLQDDPHEIPRFLAAMQEQSSMS